MRVVLADDSLLLREGVAPERVHVTGNTIVDAVLDIERRPYDVAAGALAAVPQVPHRPGIGGT